MKKIFFMIGLMLLMVISSCKKDDENSSANSDLVGTWAEKPSIEQFTFIFKSNGQGSFQCKNCETNKAEETESFTYVYNAKTNEILFSGFNDIDVGYVKFISKTSIRLYNDASYTDDWSLEMYKQ